MKNDTLMTNFELVSFFREKLRSAMAFPSPSIIFCRQYPVIVRKDASRPNFWRIILILSGKRQYQYSDGKQIVEHMLEPGEILLLPPGGGTWCGEQGCYDMLSIVCSHTMMRFVSKERAPDDPVRYDPDAFYHCGVFQKEGLELLMRALASSSVHGGASGEILRALLQECIFALNTPESNVPDTSHYLLEKILVYMEEHSGTELSCDTIGEQFGVSGNYIAQIFARNMNCGFSEYLTGLRMELARGLLEHSEMNVGEIASCCGFRQANYFIRVFRRRYACTPLRYRIRFRSRSG